MACVPSTITPVVLIILNKDITRYPFLADILVTVWAASLITSTYYWAEHLKRTKRWLWF